MEHDLAASISLLVLQLAVILVAAKLGAEVTERWLRQPPVLGELAAGMVVGPYALGALPLPLLGPLFPRPEAGGPGHLPISPELYALGQIAAVLLLFVAGLETDFSQFLSFGPAAAAVGAGGVVIPFALGAGATVALGLAPNLLSAPALFMGAILTATSVGITARVLGDIGRLDTPEGVTVLAAAVIDDVLGILVLAVVVGMVTAGGVSAMEVGGVGARALGFWLLLVALAVAAAQPLARLFGRFRSEGALMPLALAVGFLGAAAAQAVGLALIIGAYSTGLAFSRVAAAEPLRRELRPIYHLLVPIFFVVMGMLVDFAAIGGVLLFGAVVTVLAIIGKTLGCGLVALGVGFNLRGALRVGVGMLPRGEVALIVAGVGLTSGAIASDVFGVAVMMTLITTLMAPPLLVPLFRHGGAGWRATAAAEAAAARSDQHAAAPPRYERRCLWTLPSGLGETFADRLEEALVTAGAARALSLDAPEGGRVVELRRGDAVLSLRRLDARGNNLRIEVEFEDPQWAPLLVGAVGTAAHDLRALLESTAQTTDDPALASALAAALHDGLSERPTVAPVREP